jgi:4-hydroxythreonine-4-phosphate dehydrogenase
MPSWSIAEVIEVGAPLVVTMGEPAGIGGEIALMAWRAARDQNLGPFALIDDAGRLEALAAKLALPVSVASIQTLSEAEGVFARALPVLHRPLGGAASVPGRPDPAHAKRIIAAIEEAADLVLSGAAGAMVTNPIAKANLYAAGFTHPGHTEFLAAHVAKRQGGAPPEPVMMLEIPGLRVVPVTIHLSLAEAIRALSRDAIVAKGRILARALTQDFGIAAPRIAVAALNPHGGEAGTLGSEEETIIAPACAALRALGIAVEGPLPADTLFHAAARARHDAVLCMYHDQALIPLKTIDFARGVNITLGLPIVRTSPDHGTAFDIAGTGKADPSSLIAAIARAGELARHRAHQARA